MKNVESKIAKRDWRQEKQASYNNTTWQWKNKLLLTNIHIFVVITKTHALNVSMCACPYLCVEICAYVCFEGLVARPWLYRQICMNVHERFVATQWRSWMSNCLLFSDNAAALMMTYSKSSSWFTLFVKVFIVGFHTRSMLATWTIIVVCAQLLSAIYDIFEINMELCKCNYVK